MSEPKGCGADWTEKRHPRGPKGAAADWTEKRHPREPKGAAADWTDERRRSEEGRRRIKRRPEASGTTQRTHRWPPAVVEASGAF